MKKKSTDKIVGTLFDSAKTYYCADLFGLSIANFELYASTFFKFVDFFWKDTIVDLNRIERKFRFIVEDTLDGFNPMHLSMYRNGNLKTFESVFHFTNFFFSTQCDFEIFTPDIPEIDYDGLDSIRSYPIFEESNNSLTVAFTYMLKKYDFREDRGFYMDKEAFRKYLKENGCIV